MSDVHAFYAEASHLAIHDATFDPEVVVTAAIGHRDFLLIGLGLLLVDWKYECLREENTDLQKRLLELMRVQQPEWGNDDED